MNLRISEPEPVEGSWARASLDIVPDDVRRVFERHGLEPPQLRVCVSSPLHLDGSFGPAWLGIAANQLVVLEQNDDGVEVVHSSSLSEIDGVHIRKLTGGGVLVVQQRGTPLDVLRFDLSRTGIVSGIAGTLGRHLKESREADSAKKSDALKSAPSSATPKELGASLPGKLVGGPSFETLITKHREEYCPTCGRRFAKHTKVCGSCLQKGRVLARILRYTEGYRGQIALMGVLMVAGTALSLVQPQLFRIFIDDGLGAGKGHTAHPQWIPALAAAFALLLVFRHADDIFRARLGIRVGSYITNRIQASAFNHLQRLSMAFFNRQQTGALMSRLNGDARQMQGFLVEGIQYTVINLLTVVGVSATLIWMNPLLGLLVLVPVPLVVTLSAWVWRRQAQRFRILWISMSVVSAVLNDILSGMRVVKAFGQEDHEIERYGKKLDKSRDHLISAESTWQTLVPILNFIVQTSTVLIWTFGPWQVYGGKLTVGQLVAFLGYLGMIHGPLQLLTRLNDWLGRSLTAAARVFELLDTEPEVEERKDARPVPEIRGQVELRGVTFGYEPHNPVLKDVTLQVAPGEMIGLVGPSGAGKSTAINLVGRLYDVDQGAILVDGVDVRELRVADLRRQVGYVLQDAFLFSGTVSENIAYARPEASRREIIEAAVAANAHDFIMKLPDGYDTLVGERGQRLSGGERQRVSIARAILADPRILILDEATASVDTETEAKIQLALAALIRGRTTLAIAHRLSTLRHASRLVVLEEGKIAEQGTHAELMAKENGVYRRLVEIQTEWSRTIAVGG